VSLKERFLTAPEFSRYAAAAEKNADLWQAIYRTAQIPGDLLERASHLSRHWHLLVLSEDWCGDAVNTIPLLAKFVEQVPGLDLRLLPRDQNLDLMDVHLSLGTRSIPVVIALDEEFQERGWWGPRPASLQRWVRTDGLLLPKEDRYRRTRTWYARDRGRTTIEEVLEVLERAERQGTANGHLSTATSTGDTFR
jgi:hypothetical protein